MILGMPPLTFCHVAISLIGIVSGFVVIWGFMTRRQLDAWNASFLSNTVLTSVTGFIFFPFEKVTPGDILGVISLVVLAVALFARYPRHMIGVWRPVYVITAVLAQYLNFFVLIVQSFMKVPALHALAPTQSEPPFAIVQGITLVVFVALGILSVIKFREVAAPAA